MATLVGYSIERLPSCRRLASYLALTRQELQEELLDLATNEELKPTEEYSHFLSQKYRTKLLGGIIKFCIYLMDLSVIFVQTAEYPLGQARIQGEGGGKGPCPPPPDFCFILSKSRSRDRSASFVKNPKGTAFEKNFGLPPEKILDTPLRLDFQFIR